jgi:hypothetical protein
MAIDDIDTLREHIPELFADRPLPLGWANNWLIVPIDDPEVDSLAPVGAPDYEVAPPLNLAGQPQLVGSRSDFSPDSDLPNFGQGAPFPGAPLLLKEAHLRHRRPKPPATSTAP